MEYCEHEERFNDESIKIVLKYRRADKLTDQQIEAIKRAFGDAVRRIRTIACPEKKPIPSGNRQGRNVKTEIKKEEK